MKNFIKVTVLSFSIFVLAAGTAMAASPKIEIIVNNTYVDTDVAPYIKGGTTMVPLNVVQQIPGITVKWDNTSKTVTIVQNGEFVKLKAGEKTATVGSKKVALVVASSLEKGHVMVPLRFIAEAAQAHIIWNSDTRTIYVAKASDALTTQLASTNLAEARSAAFEYPRVSLLQNLNFTSDESQNQDYYFPEGKSNQFYILGGNGISYYEIVGNHSEQLWTAKLDKSTKSSNGLFFLPYKLTKQDGEVPSLNSRVAFYHRMPHIMEASYGFIETDGQTTLLGQKGMELDRFFEIPEEQ